MTRRSRLGKTRHTAAAGLPPDDLPGLDPAWSRLVHVPSTDRVGRTWHVLDTHSLDSGVTNAKLTLLCVHGNPSWSYLFRDLVALAPTGVRVVAVDQLDMGFSERTGVVRRLATRVDDLAELTDEMGIDGPVITVAHDWGGPISLGWAQRHRAQLAGVVLMNTAVHQPAGARAPGLIRLVRSRPLLNNVTVRSPTFVHGAVEMSRPRLPSDVRQGFLAPYRDAERRQAIGDFVADIPLSPEHPSAAALDQISAGLDSFGEVPALLLWGARDKVFSDLYLHDLERRLPHAAVHRYPKASHFVSEEVDAVGAILDWLSVLHVPADSTGPDVGTPSTLIETHGGLGSQVAIAEMTEAAAKVSFSEFAELVEQTAAGLAGVGVGVGVAPGDRVALMIQPGVDLAVSMYACWRAGAVIVLIDSGLGPRGMNAAIKAADPQHLIGVPRALIAARALGWPGQRIASADLALLRRSPGPLPAAPTADSPAAVVFTSGATGPSKGVRYTHGRLEAQRDALMAMYDIGSDDRLVAAFAPFALYGPGMGISSVVPDMDVAAPGTLTAGALGDAAVGVDATMVFASPAALANVVRTADGLSDAHRAAFGRVRLLLSAGAPVRPALLRSAADLFPNATAHTPYGMTECLPVASISLTEIEAAVGGDGVCVGFPVEGVEVRVRPLDELGQPTTVFSAEAGVLGEVVVRASHARQGYDRLWHTEFAASQPSGWHVTGDVGHLDQEGRLWIGGRLRDVISTADRVIAPVRFEQAVESIDGVAMAAVVGVGPRGAQAVAVVVEPISAPKSARLASLQVIDTVRSVVDVDVAAVFEVPALPVDRRHNSKIDRGRVAMWADDALRGGRLGEL